MIPSLKSVHFLITYKCSAECDHCFIWGSPRGDRGSMTTEQIDDFLAQITRAANITEVCAEGGEPFAENEVFLR